MYRLARLLLNDARAATAIEYGLIAALISLSIMGALGMFAQTAIGMWDNVAEQVENAS